VATATPADEELLSEVEAGFTASLRGSGTSWAPVPGGWALETRSLPLVWTLNQVRLTGRVGVDDLVEVAEACQGDLPYRHVVVCDADSIAALEPGLEARGWRVERDVVMALLADGHAPVADDRVVELTEDQMLELMAAWLLEERFDTSTEGLAQVLEYNRREGRYFSERRLGVLHDGEAVAVTKLRVDRAFGWVEDVYTLPAARRRGYARALVSTAVDLALAAGCSRLAIVADADDWPQHLYASVGFRPIGRHSIFHLDPPA